MRIGVKYCGGCNSTYNRGRQVTLLKEQFPEHEFCTVSDGRECEVWLAVCGCLRACASIEGLAASKRLFVLTTERSFAEVKNFLETERERAAEQEGAAEQKGATEQETASEKAGDAKMQQTTEDKAADKKRKRLRIGQEAALKKTFFRDDTEKFAALTGDYNRLHMDSGFAKNSMFGRPVVHGVLAASLISSVMGMKLPGEGTILIEEKIRFLKPVFYGDTVTAKVRLLSCREQKKQYVAVFAGICVNQNGEIVVAAKCRQLMTKDLFEIENPGETADMPEADARRFLSAVRGQEDARLNCYEFWK